MSKFVDTTCFFLKVLDPNKICDLKKTFNDKVEIYL